MNSHALYAALGATKACSGGTSQGISRDIRAVSCGLSAVFDRAAERRPVTFPFQTFDAAGKVAVKGHRAGSAFHGLQELWRTGALETTDSLPKPAAIAADDASLAAAIGAFTIYVGANLGSSDYLGISRSVEFALAGKIAGVARTGRVDAVIDAAETHIERWAQYGIYVAEPGIYLWDYKLVKGISADAGGAYSRSLQAMAYMYLYEQQTGIRPRGLVFELVSRAAKPKIARQLVLAENRPDSAAILEDFVRLAETRRNVGEANAAACDSGYDPCAFLRFCPRRGHATDPDSAAALARYRELIASSAFIEAENENEE